MTEKSAWDIFAKFIRLRDAIKTTGTTDFCTCCTCQKIKPIREIQAGHFISRRFKAIMFDERNVHGQCAVCNSPRGRGKGGNPDAYRIFMLVRYGKRVVDELEYNRKKFAQYKKSDFARIGKIYRHKTLELMNNYEEDGDDVEN